MMMLPKAMPNTSAAARSSGPLVASAIKTSAVAWMAATPSAKSRAFTFSNSQPATRRLIMDEAAVSATARPATEISARVLPRR